MRVELLRVGSYGASRLRPLFAHVCAGLMVMLAVAGGADASGPRFVTGPPFFTGPPGAAIGWRQPTLFYYTDPADLSASVPHAQADALVAAAAGVWNVPVASITVAQGGQLAEHADASNVYLDVNGMVFPADIQSGNSAAVPIAVLYDTDGSVTDTLLGQGSSNPSNCNQASVTESVDQFDPAGFILHAIIVVNGRCTGPLPEQQLELQYHLERVFGRVLGLAWSQTNDNVFTGTPVPSYAQEQHWPILHPIDINCGPYEYQCLPQPFQLRDDDIAGLVAVYPNGQWVTPPSGKQRSLAQANAAYGHILFPDGQGMGGVNILVQRQVPNSLIRDAWFEGSGVSGMNFARAGVSPFVTAGTDAAGSMGTTDLNHQGSYLIAYLPIVASNYSYQNLVISTEPVNPLYTGPYSLGPYTMGTVAPAGTSLTPSPSTAMYPFDQFGLDMTVPDAPQQCGTGSDGTLNAPMQEPASGWWTGQTCGFGHASYVADDVKPGRSFTVEVTALDAQGFATNSKLMPVLALYDPSDTTSQPTQGLASSAFQAIGLGTTALNGQTGVMTRLRLGIADQRGEGRPDFDYQARLFYADSVLPAQLGATGGNVTITGTGFRNGNNVQINGVNAGVVSWTPTAIVATMPAMAAANAAAATPLDITVSDLGTGATSTMTGAFEYVATALPNGMKLLTAQAGNSFVGQLTPVPFSVQVVMPDGVTPVVGDAVTFSSAAGNVIFGVCGGTSCTVQTDANGVASSASTPSAAGSVTLQATDGALQQTASFTALAQAGSIQVTSHLTGVPEGTTVTFSIRILAANGVAMSGRLVQFSAPAGSVTFSGCFASACSATTDSNGDASIQLIPNLPGTVTVQASDGSVSAQSTFAATDNSDVMLIAVPPLSTVSLGATDYLQVQLLRHDGITPDANEIVNFSGSSGTNLTSCGTALVCAQVTDHNGIVGILADPAALGTYTLTAAYGTVTQSASFQVVTPPSVQIRILSVPSGSVVVGTVAPQLFTVQLLQPDGVTPLTGVRLTLAGPQDSVRLGICGSGSCLVAVDGNGMVSTTVTPLLPGQITLNAVYLPAIQTATFTALGPPASLQFATQPGPGGVVVGHPSPLTVTAVAIGGTSPGVGYVDLSVSQGSAIILPCSAPCGPPLDGTGNVQFTVQALAPGPVTVNALWGAVTQTLNFYAYAQGDVVRLLSGPIGVALTQVAALPSFTVQVFGSDGITPAPGKAVIFSTSIGSVRFAACGASTCTVMSDASGIASSGVTPLTPGVTTLTAYDGAANQADTFMAQDGPDLLSLVSFPASGGFVGSAAALPFMVRAMLADGVTPAAGRSVTVSVTYGSAMLGACASVSSCTLTADANGMIATSVTPTGAGMIGLLADDRGVPVTATFAAIAQVQPLTISAVQPGMYVAQQVSVAFNPTVRVLQGGLPAPALPVLWSGVSGFNVASGSSSTDAAGLASVQATVGPLSGGVSATVSACLTQGVCSTFTATGVPPALFRLAWQSGAGQAVAGGAAYAAVVAEVTDAAAHVVAGGDVTVYQTVTSTPQPCPARGRCPAAPILATGVAVLRTGLDGRISVTPLTVAGVATQTQIAISSGDSGFATTVLSAQ